MQEPLRIPLVLVVRANQRRLNFDRASLASVGFYSSLEAEALSLQPLRSSPSQHLLPGLLSSADLAVSFSALL